MKSRVFFVAALSLCAAFVFAQGGGGAGGGGGQGRRGGFGQGRGGAFGQSELQVALRADAQRDLAVTEDQKTKLQTLRPNRGQGGGGRRGQGGAGAGGGAVGGGGAGGGAAGGGGGAAGGGGGAGAGGGGNRGQNLDPAALAARQAEQRATQHKALAEILNEGQMKRLHEIYLQVRGNQALTDPDVQKELGLSDDQKKKVADLQQKQRDAMTSIFEKMRNQEISQEDARSSMEKNGKVLDEELGKILTPDQAKTLADHKGKEFKADPPPAGRGGR